MDPNSIVPGQWVEILKGLDIAVMVMIGVISYVLTKAVTVSDNMAILVPLSLGAAWGVVEAFQAGYAPVSIVVKGVLMNGGGAAIIGRLLHTTGVLDKLWGNPPPPAGLKRELKK